MESLPLRLEIIRLINNLRFDLSYSKCLSLGNKFNEMCNSKTRCFKEALQSGAGITPFQIKLLDFLVRRFVLGLHRPYFEKAKDDHQFHFSRKICLESSLAIFAPATTPVAGIADDWTLMTYRAVGFFKGLILYAVSTVYYELQMQIEEHRESFTLTAPLVSNTTEQQAFALPPQSQALYDALVTAYHIAMLCIRNGETNAKGVVFFACAVARVDALVMGADAEAMVLATAKASIMEVRQIMAEVFEQEHGEPIDLSASMVRNKDHGRGDGADDVTGQGATTGTSADADLGSDSCGDKSTAVNNGLDVGLGTQSPSFLLDDVMGFNSNFFQDPEWFFETNGWAGVGSNMIFNDV